MGVRGYIAAYDAKTGDQVWRTYTIPGPGEPGHETWKERCLEERRCHRMDDGQLRSGNSYRLLGHRQSRAVARRPASRRQSLHGLGHRPGS